MREGILKWIRIVAIWVVAPFVALSLLAPWVAASLLAAILAPIVAGLAFVANIVTPAEQKSFRIEALVTVDGSLHRAVGIATCRRRFEAYGAENVFLARRLRMSGGHVSVALPDGRLVQSSAFLVCSDEQYASVKDRIAFYLIDRRTTPIRAQQTSLARSAANPAAPFRVEIISAGATNEAAKGVAHLPDSVSAVPPAIDDVKYALTSYIALPIAKEVWSTDDKLRAQYSVITDFRAVPKPPEDVLRRLVSQTNGWPASGTLAPDHSRVDLPAFGPALPETYIVIETRPPPGYSGPPFKFPVPQVCLGEKCVPMPVFGSELESIHTRQGYLFDPSSQTLIAIRAVFAGMYDPGKAAFAPQCCQW